MKKEAIYHVPESRYSFAYGEHELHIRLRAAKDDLDDVTLIYAVKYDWLTARKTVQMQKSFTDDLFDYYTAVLDVPEEFFKPQELAELSERFHLKLENARVSFEGVCPQCEEGLSC